MWGKGFLWDDAYIAAVCTLLEFIGMECLKTNKQKKPCNPTLLEKPLSLLSVVFQLVYLFFFFLFFFYCKCSVPHAAAFQL